VKKAMCLEFVIKVACSVLLCICLIALVVLDRAQKRNEFIVTTLDMWQMRVDVNKAIGL